MAKRARALVAAVVFATSLLTACSSSRDAAGSADGVQIVASTDVYGDLATSIAGRFGAVTSFIDDPAQDPHSYEADARNQLAVSHADVLIENGGGYDDFMSRLRRATDSSAPVIDVVALSGKRPVDGELNEHVWYDFGTMIRFVHRLTDVLAHAAPAHAAVFRANAARLDAGLVGLQRTEASIRAVDHGAKVAITEPVPLYLLQACGLVNATPPAFSAAVEAGTDVSVSTLHDTLQLFADHVVRALVYNAQTSGPETTQVLDAARSDHIPVVPVTETLPSGQHYLQWMRGNLQAVRTALAGG